MNPEEESARVWWLLRISIIIAALIVLFFSGIFPIENYLAFVPYQSLSAAVEAANVAQLTNDNRTKEGLSALTVSPLLTQAAQLKANDMAAHSYYAHVSPDGKSPLYWLSQVGYTYLNAGENLVIDRTTSEQAVSAWMNSPEHRDNILRPQFTEIGVGVAAGEYDGIKTIFVVEEFGTPYPSRIYAPSPTQTTHAVAAVVPVSTTASTPSHTASGEAVAPAASAPTKAPTSKPVSSIQKNVATLTAPILHSLVPSKPNVTLLATSTTDTATSTTSSYTFVLSPEFYTPVALASAPATTTSEVVSPLHAYTSAPAWVGKVKEYMSDIFHSFTGK